jgi:hypothetical protein
MSKPDSIIKKFSSQTSSPNFTDELFPSNFESLFSSKKEILNYESPTIPKFLKDKKKLLLSQFALSQKDGRYSWAKLPEVKDISKLNIISNTKNISQDVIQGELGDGYFLSTLSALAENPKNITNIIQNSKVSDGAYEATIYIHGEPVKVSVDDSFPVANASKIAFAGINDNTGSIWPMILEKIWAKCNKSYEDIIPGNSSDAFEFLTPAPFDNYFHTQDISSSLFNIIQEASNKNYIILADITETKNTNLDTLSKMGLITNHAYSVIGTAVLKKPNGNEIQLIKMKNIWGTNEWIGDWSDKSLKWTQEFKKAVGLQEKEDGIFWMSYDDYLQFYTTTHIAQVYSNFNYNVIKMKNKEEQNICKIHVERGGSGYFMLNLKNTRIYNNLKNQNYINPYCSVMVIKKKSENNFEYVGGDSGKKDRYYIPAPEMEKGDYYMVVTFPKNNKNNLVQEKNEYNQTEFSFRIGVYSSIKDIKFTPLLDDKSEIDDYMFYTLLNRAQSDEEKYFFAQEGEPTSWRTINFNNDKNGLGYIFYNNESDAYIKERIEISSIKNVNIIPLLKNGFFISNPSEVKSDVIANKEDPNSKSKNNTHRSKKNLDNIDDNNKVNEKIDYESKTISETINALKGTKLESTFEKIDEGKPPIIQINIAPHCQCAILLQKTGEESDIDISSDICFDYMPNVLLGEQKFPQKKYRLRYNNKPVEVYECIAEHNTGVFFQYKNRSTDFRVKITAKFSKYENLYLLITSSDLENGGTAKLRKCVEGQFRDDNDDNFVELVIEPGETGFFGLNAVDVFEKFSYSCQFDYHFSLFKISSNLMNFEQGNVNKEEVKDI